MDKTGYGSRSQDKPSNGSANLDKSGYGSRSQDKPTYESSDKNKTGYGSANLDKTGYRLSSPNKSSYVSTNSDKTNYVLASSNKSSCGLANTKNSGFGVSSPSVENKPRFAVTPTAQVVSLNQSLLGKPKWRKLNSISSYLSSCLIPSTSANEFNVCKLNLYVIKIGNGKHLLFESRKPVTSQVCFVQTT